MSSYRRAGACLALALLLAVSARAQSTAGDGCSTAVSRAERAYEDGAFHASLEDLAPCLPEGLTADDIWRGYRLRALDYLMLDDPDSADRSIGYLLRYNPNYVPVAGVDPYEFIQALSHYTDYAQFAMGVFLDGLATKVLLLQANTLTQTSASANSYAMPIKVNAGAEAMYSFNPHFSAGFDAALLYEDISRSVSPIRGLSTKYTESISSVAVPVFARYRLDSANVLGTRIQPFFEAGGFAQWITPIAAEIALSGDSAVAGTLADPNPGSRRKALNYGWTVSAGLAIPLSGAEILIRGRYWNGLADVTRPSARYSSSLFLPAYYEDDDIALHGFELSVGINLLFGFHEYRYGN